MRKLAMHSHYSKTVLYALFSATLTVFSASASAVNQGDWLVRAGVGYVSPNDSSGQVYVGGSNIAGSGVSVDSSTGVQLTIAYMMTPNINVELLGALPFKHDIKGSGTLAGLGKIAETDELPPTLVINYMFNPQTNIRPYVGAGLNYTTFFNTDTKGALAGHDMDIDDSWGAAVDAGVDVDINKDWFFNASIWYMDISTTANIDSVKAVSVDINPWALAVGIGTHF
jgi:outer membrane protein